MARELYSLFEYNTLDNVYLPIRGTARVKYTCFDVSRSYLIFGANSGSLYFFQREPLQYVCVLSNKEGSVTLLSVAPGEKCLAFSTSKGNLTLLQHNVGNCIHERINSSLASSPHYMQVKHDFGEAAVTSLQWDSSGDRLFVGDSKGKVVCVNVRLKKSQPFFKIKTTMVVVLDSPIFQMDFCLERLLISTQTGCYFCDTTKEQYSQIGSKPRIGDFGACFYKNAQQATPTIYAARPGSRFWEVDFDGSVLCTHQFKKALATPPVPPVSIRARFCPPDASIKFQPQTLNFQKLAVIGERFVFTSTKEKLLVFDPVSVGVLLWSNHSPDVVQFKVFGAQLYLWDGDGKLRNLHLTKVEEGIACLLSRVLWSPPPLCMSTLVLTAELCRFYRASVIKAAARSHLPSNMLVELASNLENSGETSLALFLNELVNDLEVMPAPIQVPTTDVETRNDASISNYVIESGIYIVNRPNREFTSTVSSTTGKKIRTPKLPTPNSVQKNQDSPVKHRQAIDNNVKSFSQVDDRIKPQLLDDTKNLALSKSLNNSWDAGATADHFVSTGGVQTSNYSTSSPQTNANSALEEMYNCSPMALSLVDPYLWPGALFDIDPGTGYAALASALKPGATFGDFKNSISSKYGSGKEHIKNTIGYLGDHIKALGADDSPEPFDVQPDRITYHSSAQDDHDQLEVDNRGEDIIFSPKIKGAKSSTSVQLYGTMNSIDTSALLASTEQTWRVVHDPGTFCSSSKLKAVLETWVDILIATQESTYRAMAQSACRICNKEMPPSASKTEVKSSKFNESDSIRHSEEVASSLVKHENRSLTAITQSPSNVRGRKNQIEQLHNRNDTRDSHLLAEESNIRRTRSLDNLKTTKTLNSFLRGRLGKLNRRRFCRFRGRSLDSLSRSNRIATESTNRQSRSVDCLIGKEILNSIGNSLLEHHLNHRRLMRFFRSRSLDNVSRMSNRVANVFSAWNQSLATNRSSPTRDYIRPESESNYCSEVVGTSGSFDCLLASSDMPDDPNDADTTAIESNKDIDESCSPTSIEDWLQRQDECLWKLGRSFDLVENVPDDRCWKCFPRYFLVDPWHMDNESRQRVCELATICVRTKTFGRITKTLTEMAERSTNSDCKYERSPSLSSHQNEAFSNLQNCVIDRARASFVRQFFHLIKPQAMFVELRSDEEVTFTTWHAILCGLLAHFRHAVPLSPSADNQLQLLKSFLVAARCEEQDLTFIVENVFRTFEFVNHRDILYLSLIRDESNTSDVFLKLLERVCSLTFVQVENPTPSDGHLLANHLLSCADDICNDPVVHFALVEAILKHSARPSFEDIKCSCGNLKYWPYNDHFGRASLLLKVIKIPSQHDKLFFGMCEDFGFWPGYLHIISRQGGSRQDILTSLLQLSDMALLRDPQNVCLLPDETSEWIRMMELVIQQENQTAGRLCLFCGSLLKEYHSGSGDMNSGIKMTFESVAQLFIMYSLPDVATAAISDLVKKHPNMKLSSGFYRHLLLSASIKWQQRNLAYNMLEKIDAYVWSRNKNSASPQICSQLQKELRKEPFVAEPIDRSRSLTDLHCHWGVTFDLKSHCPVCTYSLATTVASNAQGGIRIFPCGHGFHQQCIRTSTTCSICFS